MLTFRHQLLETFGIDHDFTAIMNDTIKLEFKRDSEPFGEIVTDKTGKTTLRVGQVLSKGPIVKIRY